MSISISTVDAFTSVPFAGNPAAVAVLEKPMEETTMQIIAREMNLSETAFVVPLEEDKDGEPLFHLRWFTPEVEVPLCGHATLATTHTIFTQFPQLIKGKSRVHYKTLSGILSVEQAANGKFQMNFPQGKPIKVTLSNDVLTQLKELLPLPGVEDIVDVYHCSTTRKLLVEVNSSDIINNLNLNRAILNVDFGDLNVKGIIVTTNSFQEEKYKKYDFVSRYFAPWLGIPEDPVTGSAHTVLAVYWSNKLNKKNLFAFQASKRGGELGIEVKDDGRVILEGSAVTVLQGQLKLQ